MKLLKAKKGSFSIGGIIMTVIGIIIAVTVIPLALTAITESEGNYTATQYLLLGLVGLALVVGVLLAALAAAGIKIKM